MSSDADKAVVILAVGAGCIDALRIGRAFARVDIKRKLDEAFAAYEKAILEWPGVANQRGRRWTQECVDEFKAFIHNTQDKGYPDACMLCMCDRGLIDLMEKEFLPHQLALLKPIHDAVATVHRFVDPDGLNFMAFEKSDELLDELYRIIKFERRCDEEDRKRARADARKKRKAARMGNGSRGHAGKGPSWRRKVRDKTSGV